MTMQQMGQVFGVDRSVIGKHIRNIYKTGELEQKSTWAKIAQNAVGHDPVERKMLITFPGEEREVDKSLRESLCA